MRFSNTCILPFVLIMVMFLSLCSLGLGLSKKHLHIINDLSSDTSLTLHRKSKDDDIGNHDLAFQQDLGWSFRDNFFHTTLFWCFMQWYDPTTNCWVHKSFDVYEARKWKEDQYHCIDCFWSIRKDGIYRNSHQNCEGFEFIHMWDKC
ncbi:hypothetical protein ACHQM5_006858 [Ranunculus cassubicifolius]